MNIKSTLTGNLNSIVSVVQLYMFKIIRIWQEYMKLYNFVNIIEQY